MSTVKEQAVQMIQELPDDTVLALVNFIKQLKMTVSKDTPAPYAQTSEVAAYHRFQEISAKIRKYLPDDFDPERELSEARSERFLQIISPVDTE